MADLWNDFTDFVITNIDKKIGNKYKMSLRNFLTNPTKYGAQPDIENTIKNMGQDVNDYIDGTVATMPEEAKMLEDALSKADAITKQIASTISMQAKQSKVPFIKPVSVNRDPAKEETVLVDSANADVLALVQKLVGTATLIADFSYTYNDSMIGNWFFSGPKNYSINVYMPDNDVALLEASRDEINGLLTGASLVVKGI